MTRFRAASIHLLLSGLIVLTLIVLMFGLWYPDKYFALMGGDGLIYLIGGVDICLGPLLTLVVFKSGKKSLAFDLSVIALLQLAALSYGSYTMFNSRPVFTAYAKGEFQVATANEITDEELKRAKNTEWKKRPLTGPAVVAAIEPTDKKDKEDTSFVAAFGAGLAQFPRLFVPYQSQREDILRKAKPIKELRKITTKNEKSIDEFLSEQSRPEQNFVYLPIYSAYTSMAAILDAKTGEFVSIIEAKP